MDPTSPSPRPSSPSTAPHGRLPHCVSALPDTPAPPLAGGAPAGTPAQAALYPAAPVIPNCGPDTSILSGTVPVDLFTFSAPLTLGQLAAQLALAFQSFVVNCSTHQPALNVGSWHIAPSEGNIASTTGISFDRLVLFALWNVCDDVWMAEVFADPR
ncbi:hypothetical protein ID866_11884 [Astraeus odoratus]|nr:hypothetical protein ID866_11884 [Astraeus odoratus]